MCSLKTHSPFGEFSKSPLFDRFVKWPIKESPAQIPINIKHDRRLPGKQTESPTIWTFGTKCRTHSSTGFSSSIDNEAAPLDVSLLLSISLHLASHILRAALRPKVSRDADDDDSRLMLIRVWTWMWMLVLVWFSLAKRFWLNTTILKLLNTHAHKRSGGGENGKMGKRARLGCSAPLHVRITCWWHYCRDNEKVKNLKSPAYWIQSIARNSHLLAGCTVVKKESHFNWLNNKYKKQATVTSWKYSRLQMETMKQKQLPDVKWLL